MFNKYRSVNSIIRLVRYITLISAFGGAILCSFQAPASDPETLKSIIDLIQQVNDPQFHLDLLKGMDQALEGKRSVPMPDGWTETEVLLRQSPNPEVRSLSQSLGVKFGSSSALVALQTIAFDTRIPPIQRSNALQTLVTARDPELAAQLAGLLPQQEIRNSVFHAMAAMPHPSHPPAIIQLYPSLSAEEKKLAINTLSSRAESASSLIDSLQNGSIPPRDLRAEVVRQLRSFNNPDFNQALEKLWGSVIDTPDEIQSEIARYKNIYFAGGSQPGDASRGRTAFLRLCFQCHELFESGGRIGPSLTGSNRADLDYILENIVHPNAVVPNDYQSTTIETSDFRFLNGIIQTQSPDAVILKTISGLVSIPQNEIVSISTAPISMMPEGLLNGLNHQEFRDLIVYLKSPSQVPLIASPENLNLFFNGEDLSFWNGDPELWSVSNGEIIGQSATGLDRNAFLISDLLLSDFSLSCEVKLSPNTENSGIQFRSKIIDQDDVQGYQADIGAGWWGKLYEEHGRGLLWDISADSHVRPNDWNTYEIKAQGPFIQTFINGKLSVNLTDPDGSCSGIVALQLHSGGPMEIRFRNFHLNLTGISSPNSP